VYSAAPSTGAGAGAAARAVAMAWTCVVVRFESEPMPPALFEMAVWIWAAVFPTLLLAASDPWHPLQYWV
jgi:hypothetical protein